jgi:hypothetical protein
MTKYASVVVVDAESETAAFDCVVEAFVQSNAADFVGSPWQVEDRSEEANYDTHTLIGEMAVSTSQGSAGGFAVGDLVVYQRPEGDPLGLPPYEVESVEKFGPNSGHWRYVIRSTRNGARIAGVVTPQLVRA